MNINQIKSEINAALLQQTDLLCAQLLEIDAQLIPITEALKEYLVEGKRFRSIFSVIGYLGTGHSLTSKIFEAASALEFLQASALIHDDLMDDSDTRRGKPAIHKQFAKNHGENFGAAAAILIGDLALAWNEQSLHLSAITNSEVDQIHDVMRTELMAGQYLDVLEQTLAGYSVERSLKIARYKSGKYSIERPLHFGAALANPDNLNIIYDIYSEYGLPLGEAFQLRDDLLGVFGDPAETGKPAGDDLKEGKKTALIAFAHDRGDKVTKNLIETKLGTNLTTSEIDTFRQAIVESGAAIHVEDLIEKLAESALDAIERTEITLEAKNLLTEMVSVVTKRNR